MTETIALMKIFVCVGALCFVGSVLSASVSDASDDKKIPVVLMMIAIGCLAFGLFGWGVLS